MVPRAVRVALRCGETELGGRVAKRCHAVLPFEQGVADTTRGLLGRGLMATQEVAARHFLDAAAHWRGFGVPYEEAQALLGQGRCLVGLGRAPEAAPPLAAAREIFARLGAKPALADTDELIQKAAPA